MIAINSVQLIVVPDARAGVRAAKSAKLSGARRRGVPYGWLGVGAVGPGIGVGAALAGGVGVAHADGLGVDSASVSGHAQDRGAVTRTVQRASVSGGGATRSVAPAALPSRAWWVPDCPRRRDRNEQHQTCQLR